MWAGKSSREFKSNCPRCWLWTWHISQGIGKILWKCVNVKICSFFHRHCVQYCFLPLIEKQLFSECIEWNSHSIRKQAAATGPFGKPDLLFFCPPSGNLFFCWFYHLSPLLLCQEPCCHPQSYSQHISSLVRSYRFLTTLAFSHLYSTQLLVQALVLSLPVNLRPFSLPTALFTSLLHPTFNPSSLSPLALSVPPLQADLPSVKCSTAPACSFSSLAPH